MEVNPRLQVEHSVSEYSTGIDLVELQFRLADRYRLRDLNFSVFKNRSPSFLRAKSSGMHAIEVRIYAESVRDGRFLPSFGTVKLLRFPTSEFVRVDATVYEGMTISDSFDGLLFKLTAFGVGRHSVIERLCNFLSGVEILGVDTNIEFILSLLRSEQFLTGKVYTDSCERERFVRKILSSRSVEECDSISGAENSDLFCAQLVRAIVKKISRENITFGSDTFIASRLESSGSRSNLFMTDGEKAQFFARLVRAVIESR